MTKFEDLHLPSVGHTIQLSGAVYSGEGKHFLCFLPGERFKEPELHFLDMSLDEWKQFLQQTDLLDIEGTMPGPNGELVKALYRKSQRQIDTFISWRVFKRDLYQCRYCSNNNVPLTVDHIICWEDLGATVESNLLSSCKHCNKVRGNTEYSQWLKHPYYLDVSRNLSKYFLQANLDIVSGLSSIPRVKTLRSRK
jgi:hypothetical protein